MRLGENGTAFVPGDYLRYTKTGSRRHPCSVWPIKLQTSFYGLSQKELLAGLFTRSQGKNPDAYKNTILFTLPDGWYCVPLPGHICVLFLPRF